MRRVGPVLLAVLAMTGGCSRPVSPPARAPLPATPHPGPTTSRSAHVSLEFVGATIVRGGSGVTALGGAEFGGLSACAMDPSGDVLAVSDDRDRPSLFRVSVRPDANGVHVTPLSATALELAPERPGAPDAVDLEGMVLLGTRLLLSSEGDEDAGDPPAVLEYTLGGRFVSATSLPPVFLPASEPPGRGLRWNLAFEGLAQLPDGRLLLAAEAPTQQDGELPGVGRGAWARWAQLVPEGDGWRPGPQLAYAIDPLPAMPGVTVVHQETGVSEVLALGADRVLTLERGFVRTADRRSFNLIRIYDVSIAGADDVSGVASLAAARFRPVGKSLVVDFDAWKPRFGPGLGALANFEAMCLGPVLPDGSRTILLISDNNFRPTQLMAFALFRLDVH